MDTFEDENPFGGEGDRNIPSDNSSSSKLNVSEPTSPQLDSTLRNEYTAPAMAATPSYSKNDHWLQSGEEIEILVSLVRACETRKSNYLDKIVDAQKTTVNSSSPYITYVIKAGVSCRTTRLDTD